MAQETRQKIALISVDGKEIRKMEQTERAIMTYYNCEITRIPSVELPSWVMKNGSDTIRSGSLLQYLRNMLKNLDFDKIIAFSERPLYFSYSFQSIRGVGTLGGKTAIISTYKIKNESKRKRNLRRSLIQKVSRHEFGHMLGLEHCTDKSGCVMTPGMIEAEFYAAGSTLCDKCLRKVEDYVKTK